MTDDGAPGDPPDIAPGLPPAFDEYRLVRRLGGGAMGEVYLAEDVLLQRPVAVKFVRATDAGPAATERFYVEARAIARLQHPHVVAIYRVGRVRRRPYLVSEYVSGDSLDKLALPLAPERVLEIGAALASGLAAAHRRGVLHRDIKPANVVVSAAGDIKLLDFGLAKLLDAEPHAALARDSDEGATTRPDASAGPESIGARTQPGALLGSPLYMAPELWRGEPATAATDIYALGVLLYELCAGRPPRAPLAIDELLRDVQTRDTPPLAEVAGGVPTQLAAAIDRCVHRDPAARFHSADALRRALDALHPGGARVATTAPLALDPYRGLAPFGSEHRAVFFGRDDDARAIVDRLRGDAFVLVAGDSGVGKSSLCAAGVLPRIADAGLDGGARAWSTVELVPGRHPLTALARALAPALELDEDLVLAAMRGEPGEVGRQLHRRLGSERGVVIYVDQLEELITVSDPGEAAQAAEVLGELAARAPHRRLLATARSDFLTRFTVLPGLGEDVALALYLLGPLTRAGVRSAIVGPARAAGVELESAALVDELAGAAAGGDGLPLLQFALATLWEARDRERRVVPAAALAAMGGVGGALVGHADRLIEQLGPARHAAARRILVGLVTTDGTRIKRTAAELDGSPDGRAVLEALVRGRLVIARDGDRDGPATYELAHEILVSAWDTLRAWMSGDVERRAARERLERAARDWDRLGRPHDALWSPRQLAEIADIDPAALDPRAAAFAQTSRRAVRRRALIRRGLAIAALLAVASTYAGVRIQAERALAARVADQLAAAARTLAHARSLDAQIDELRRGALAGYDTVPYDAPALEQADARWARIAPLAAERDRDHDAAERALETALLLDASRHDTRAQLAGLLEARALAADHAYQLDARDAYLARREVYARDGAATAAAATLTLATLPAGASVALARYADGDRRELGPPRPLGTTPLPATEIAPGSYRLTITASGREAVQYPILLGRAERRDLRLELPDRVPPGMVYVPPGRFLYGSGDAEAMRMFFQAQPLHPVELPGFFIGRHEVTFAEWIEFLRALPAEERSRRIPSSAEVTATVQLESVGERWRLTLQAEPGGPTLSAMDGEPVRYPARQRRGSQDWLRFPVIGISWDDVVAYGRWLDRTGRVPGARPCDEREWERAARGADDRRYPHGDQLVLDDANFDLTYGQTTGAFGPDEVGSHPASDSPFGVADLAGNVWEWARSLQNDQLVFRSGTFYRDQNSNQVINRLIGAASGRNTQVGARLCADAPRKGVFKEP